MSDERIPRRLQLAREGSRMGADRVRLERMAAEIDRQQGRRRVRQLALGAAAAATVAVAVASWQHGPPAPGSPAGQRATGQSVPGAAPSRPRLVQAPPTSGPTVARLEGQGARDTSTGPLVDLAADRTRAAALWAAYRRSPDTHPTLPNVSFAGYRPGRPAGRAAATVVNVRAPPFRAAGDGVSDDTEAIRRAIQSVERGGGVVYLPDGDYLVSKILFVASSNTVLRGQSRDGTRLLFTRPLDLLLGTNVEGAYSRWQWSGGLVWFAARAHQPPAGSGGGSDWKADGWSVGPELTRVAAPASRGDRTIQVASSAGLRPGALVFLIVDAPEPGGTEPPWPREAAADGDGPAAAVMRWPVEIAAVEGRRVTLEQPLRFDVPLALGPRLRASREADLLRDSGIERMTLVMQRDRQWDGLGLVDVHGWNGVFFQEALHAFARELVVIDGHQAAATAAAKNVTLSDIALRSTGVQEGAVFPRGIAVRSASHDVLVERVDVDRRYWFRLRIEGSGHAVSRIRGPLRWVGGPSADALLTDITVLDHPADAIAAPPGLRIAAWGIQRAAPGPLPLPEPPNLYEAQRLLGR
jgi:hypothetical protein